MDSGRAARSAPAVRFLAGSSHCVGFAARVPAAAGRRKV